MSELIYKDLSYAIVGFIYQIDNHLGYGHEEKVYADVFEKILQKENVKYKRELYCPVIFEGEVISRRFLDFLIDDKIIVEIKVGNYRYKSVCSQLFEYLRNNNIKLGLIARFSKHGVDVKRIVNLYE
jgi:GxxExxY protein